MVTTHFDLVSGLSWAPGGPKRAPFGPKCPLALNFHGPILCGNFFSKYRLVGCPEHRSGMLCSSSTVIVHIEPPSLRKRPKRGKKGPFWPKCPKFPWPYLCGIFLCLKYSRSTKARQGGLINATYCFGILAQLCSMVCLAGLCDLVKLGGRSNALRHDSHLEHGRDVCGTKFNFWHHSA